MAARSFSILLITASLLTAACGGTPTQGDDESGSNDVGYDDVMAEIDGLDQEERWARLVELAEDEEGTFQVYGTLQNDQLEPVMEDFVETAGIDIDVNHFRSGSVNILQRITEEAEAGNVGADAVITIATDLNILGNRDILQQFTTPAADDAADEVIFPDWAGIYINVYTLARNTNVVGTSDAPTTWEEVLNYTGVPVGIEVQSYDWFATLVTDYFMAQQDMTEEEAVAQFMEVQADLTPVRGRSTLTELTMAGEYGLAAGTYTHEIDVTKDEGAPIEWEDPLVEPLVQRPNGVAPAASSDMPATTLLFVDYMLSEPGQRMLASFSRIPTNQTVEGALPEEYEVLTVNVDEMVENHQKWTDLYSQVTGEPVED